ncbi:MAG: hypothetical protein U9R53_00540 [Chloroflexota bacterium]|nr:hypothetical protein [Chloroflexota bacterium]
MTETAQPLIERANALIKSDQLRPKAKAFLLLKLSQIHALLSSEKADEYWQLLQSQQRHLVNEDKTLMETIRPMLEEEEDPTKGFAGEKIAEIKSKIKQPGLTEGEIREFLEEKTEEVKKRFWPAGKQAVWQQLVQVWKVIDRKQALALTAKLSNPKRLMQVRRMNRENTLSVEEWYRFVDENSKNEAVRIITAILDDPQPRLTIPGDLVVPVVSGLVSKMTSATQLKNTLDQINKFLTLVATKDSHAEVLEALKKSAKTLANAPALANQWPEKFQAALNLVILGTNLGVINEATASSFAQNLPRHMVDFSLASCYGLFSNAENLQANLSEVIKTVSQKDLAEDWFLVLVTQRGFGEQAYDLASESPRKPQLLPRICRAWLSNHPQAATVKIKPEDIKDDLIAQILFRTDKSERVAFLREITQQGNKFLPGGMWVSKTHEEEKKGFWGSLLSSGKTFDQIIQEYLKRNPLYASYRRNTPAAQQFEEFLRFSGHGEYSCNRLDPILLESMIMWAEEHPQEVKHELDQMWKAIEPDDDILKLDFLRNAIFTRCTTVLAAVPEVLEEVFLTWLKRKLIDHSIVWQWGKTQYTVRYPPTALASMCLQGAIATQKISPDHRDQLVESALTKYDSNDQLSELGAQLYNSGKEILDIDLPWKTKTSVLDGWQLGIVKNAIPAIIQEVVQSNMPSEQS